jgi:hypothetical protein
MAPIPANTKITTYNPIVIAIEIPMNLKQDFKFSKPEVVKSVELFSMPCLVNTAKVTSRKKVYKGD